MRRPLVEISTSKSDCTEDCSHINCGFLFDVGLNNSDANIMYVLVDGEVEGEPPVKTQQISGGGGENVEEGVNAKGHRKEEHKMPRNIARRRRRTKIRRIPLQREVGVIAKGHRKRKRRIPRNLARRWRRTMS